MTVFVCLDEQGGMMFNKRRQSRDKRVIEDVVRCADDGLLYISDYSEPLFEDSAASVISVPNPLEAAGDGAYVFCEDMHLSDYVDRIDRLIVYNWNERYPADFSLDIDVKGCGFKLRSRREFVGKSHEKVTREDYIK